MNERIRTPRGPERQQDTKMATGSQRLRDGLKYSRRQYRSSQALLAAVRFVVGRGRATVGDARTKPNSLRLGYRFHYRITETNIIHAPSLAPSCVSLGLGASETGAPCVSRQMDHRRDRRANRVRRLRVRRSR